MHCVALVLDEKYAWAIASRGETYLLLGCKAEAQADLNKALSLKENDWHFYWRGLLYLTQNQTESANADLTRAIGLATADYDKDPQDWQNTLNLMLYHLVSGDHALAERFLQFILFVLQYEQNKCSVSSIIGFYGIYCW